MIQQPLERPGFVNGTKIIPVQVLEELEFFELTLLCLDYPRGDFRQSDRLGRQQTTRAGDKAVLILADLGDKDRMLPLTKMDPLVLTKTDPGTATGFSVVRLTTTHQGVVFTGGVGALAGSL